MKYLNYLHEPMTQDFLCKFELKLDVTHFCNDVTYTFKKPSIWRQSFGG